MIGRVDAITTLASVVLGAVLALAASVWTERWKQRKEARAAARLVWLELRVGHASLLVVLALEEWQPVFLFSDDVWTDQRDRLALVRSAEEFGELQDAYLILGTIARTSPGDRDEPVLFWPALVKVEKAFKELGEYAGIEHNQLDELRVPLQERLAKIRTGTEQVHARAEGQGETMDDPVTKALNEYPPELRARAAEALERALRRQSGA
jgi:hypothetical protein